MLITRDGKTIEHCKIIQLSDSKLIYTPKDGPHRKEIILPVEDVYMLKFDKSRNIYITSTGRKMSNESGIIPKGADAIYLKEGRQLIGFGTRMNDGMVSYLISNDPKALPFANEISKSEIFMIRRANGSTEIINPF